jgi:hypothetical protein
MRTAVISCASRNAGAKDVGDSRLGVAEEEGFVT